MLEKEREILDEKESYLDNEIIKLSFEIKITEELIDHLKKFRIHNKLYEKDYWSFIDFSNNDDEDEDEDEDEA